MKVTLDEFCVLDGILPHGILSKRRFRNLVPRILSFQGTEKEDTGNEVEVFRIFYQFAHFWKILDPNLNLQKKNYSRVHLTLQLCSLTKLLAFPRQPRERKGLQDLLAAS